VILSILCAIITNLALNASSASYSVASGLLRLSVMLTSAPASLKNPSVINSVD
jgi:hypothetical protein